MTPVSRRVPLVSFGLCSIAERRDRREAKARGCLALRPCWWYEGQGYDPTAGADLAEHVGLTQTVPSTCRENLLRWLVQMNNDGSQTQSKGALWQSQNKSGKSIQETLGVQASQRKLRSVRRVGSCPSADWGEVRSPGPGHPPSHPQPDRRLLTYCLQGLISSGLVSNEPWHPPESTLITWS